jgi:hypothetical protein
LRCNRWEREAWRVWRPKFKWSNLCPIWFADRFGLTVVMARALPVTQEEVDAEGLDYYPMINCERKPEDHGRVDGRLVCSGLRIAGCRRGARAARDVSESGRACNSVLARCGIGRRFLPTARPRSAVPASGSGNPRAADRQGCACSKNPSRARTVFRFSSCSIRTESGVIVCLE